MVHSGASASIPTEGPPPAVLDLIGRLASAEAGSRDLDLVVLCAVDGCSFEKRDRDREPHLYDSTGRRREAMLGRAGSIARELAVTRSLDAALALAERVLPGHVFWSLTHSAVIAGQERHYAEVSGEAEGAAGEGEAATPALAVCAAILKATTAAS